MTSATRLFMLNDANQLLRLPTARYLRMVRDAPANPLIGLASRRVRCAEAVVELVSRKPVRVTRMMFWTVDFDDRGILDTKSLGLQCVAALDALLSKLWPGPQTVNVVEASARFVANGGGWQPTPAQRLQIRRAALRQIDCATLDCNGLAPAVRHGASARPAARATEPGRLRAV